MDTKQSTGAVYRHRTHPNNWESIDSSDLVSSSKSDNSKEVKASYRQQRQANSLESSYSADDVPNSRPKYSQRNRESLKSKSDKIESNISKSHSQHLSAKL
jgi:hypothetical protein